MRSIRRVDGTGRFAGSRPDWLTKDQERAIRRVWASGGGWMDAARAAGIRVRLLRARLEDQLADLPRRGRGAGRKRAAPRDPTEEEIWGRLTLEIQATWTDEEREERWLGRPSDFSGSDSRS
jgi:hypothetical protein